MTSESYYGPRCGAERAGGGLCLAYGVERHGGRCWAHRMPRVQTPSAAKAVEVRWCKAITANGTVCRCAAAWKAEYCRMHLRIALRDSLPRSTPGEHRFTEVTERVRNEKRLEAENDDLRNQITSLTLELERTRRELAYARAGQKPAPERVHVRKEMRV